MTNGRLQAGQPSAARPGCGSPDAVLGLIPGF